MPRGRLSPVPEPAAVPLTPSGAAAAAAAAAEHEHDHDHHGDDEKTPTLTPDMQARIDAILKAPPKRGALARAIGMRYDADLLPVALVFTMFAADAYVVFNKSALFNLLWFVVFMVPKAGIASWNHHHAHLATFEGVLANRMLEFVYMWITFVSTGVWQMHHVVGHHRHYLDQTKDESGWRLTNGRVMGSIEYGIEVFSTAYYRAFTLGRQHTGLLKQFLSILPFLVVFYVSMLYLRWQNTLITWTFAPLVSLYITAWHTYFQHSGLPDTESHFEASYNIEDPLYNVLTLNLGYHTTHHFRGTIHWSLLPQVHAIIRPLIAEHLFRLPPFPMNYISKPIKRTPGKHVSRVRQFPPDSAHRWGHMEDVMPVPAVLRTIG